MQRIGRFEGLAIWQLYCRNSLAGQIYSEFIQVYGRDCFVADDQAITAEQIFAKIKCSAEQPRSNDNWVATQT